MNIDILDVSTPYDIFKGIFHSNFKYKVYILKYSRTLVRNILWLHGSPCEWTAVYKGVYAPSSLIYRT